MAGLRNICRAYGSMKVNNTLYVWDYAAEEPAKEAEMPFGSERWRKSEAAKGALMMAQREADSAAKQRDF